MFTGGSVEPAVYLCSGKSISVCQGITQDSDVHIHSRENYYVTQHLY
jgi:hypothetical protein